MNGVVIDVDHGVDGYDTTVDIELEDFDGSKLKVTGIDPMGKWVQGCAAQWAVRVGTRVRFNIQAFD